MAPAARRHAAGQGFIVERPVQEADGRAGQRDRMRHAPPDDVGIADDGVERQRKSQQPEMIE